AIAGGGEELQPAACLHVQRVHRAQQRRLQGERIARPGGEGRGDGEERPRGTLYEVRGRSRIAGGVSAGLEGRAQSTRREAGRVGLTLDQVLPRELRDGATAHVRRDERVVL